MSLLEKRRVCALSVIGYEYTITAVTVIAIVALVGLAAIIGIIPAFALWQLNDQKPNLGNY